MSALSTLLTNWKIENESSIGEACSRKKQRVPLGIAFGALSFKTVVSDFRARALQI